MAFCQENSRVPIMPWRQNSTHTIKSTEKITIRKPGRNSGISMPNSNEGTSRTISVAILRRVAAGSIRSISVLPAFGLYSFRPSPSGWSVAHIITYSLMLYHGQLRLFEIHSVCNALTASCILCSYLNRTTIRPPSCT